MTELAKLLFPRARSSRLSDFNLTRYFVVTSAFVILLATVTVSAIFGELTHQQMIEESQDDAVSLARHMESEIGPTLIAVLANLEALESDALRGQLESELARYHDWDVALVRLYDRRGRWVFSEADARPDSLLDDSAGLEQALAGQSWSAFQASDEIPEDHLTYPLPAYVVETYMPVHSADGRQVIGALEVYRDVVADYERARRMQNAALVIVTLAMGGLFAALGIIVRRGDRVLAETSLRYHRLVELSPDAIGVQSANKIAFMNPAGAKLFGAENPEQLIGKSVWDFVLPDHRETVEERFRQLRETGTVAPFIELRFTRLDGTYVDAEVAATPFTYKGEPAIQAIFHDITERKRAEEELHYRVEFEKLITTTSTNFINLAPGEIDDGINSAIQAIGEFASVDRSYVFLFSDDGTKMDNTHEWCAEGIEPQIDNLKGLPVEVFPWWVEKLNRYETIHIPRVADLPPEASAEKEILQSQDIQSLIVVPMVFGGSLVGFLGFDSVRVEKTWTEDSAALLKIVGEVFASAFERERAEDELRRQAAELEALAEVSSALRAATTVEEMLPIFLQKATEVMGATSGAIFLVEPETGDPSTDPVLSLSKQPDLSLSKEPTMSLLKGSGQTLVVRGLHPPKPDLLGLRHRSGEGITGHVAATGKIHISEDLARDPLARTLPDEAERLGTIRSHIALPLRTQERTVGVMHIGLDEQRAFADDELRLLTAIAEMAGNAIHRVDLYEKTVRQAQDLAQLLTELEDTYDATLNALSAALDARDHEIEGHSRRVTQLAVTIAHTMGLPRSEVEALTRGALLHDIGKIGVPDSILSKPESLTDEERAEMQRHPQIGYDMLKDIRFLAPALPVVLCHHERWDGTGYPQGLRGEAIPLVARIFAVADAYDAMTSERPYRRARSHAETRAEIRRNAGQQFDPQVVDVFLTILP